MGATATGRTGKTTTETTGTTAGGSGNSSTKPTQNGGGGARGTGRKTTVNTEQNNELAIVDKKQPKQVTIDVPSADNKDEKPTPKPRGRPKGSGNKPTPRKPSSAKTKIDAAQISVLLQTMTAILASRPQMAPFALTKEEADQIANPLANIMGKNDAFAEAAGEYADHITLLVAAITIFVPKFLMYKMQRDAAIAQLPKTQEVQHANETREASKSTSTGTKQNGDTARVQTNSGSSTGTTIHYLGSPI